LAPIQARQGIIPGKPGLPDRTGVPRQPAFRHIPAVLIALIGALRQKVVPSMKRLLTLLSLATVVVALALLCPSGAQAQRAEYTELVTRHALANGLPPALVHRVIMRESRYNPSLVGRGGTIGLMQIKLATARGLGYTGTAEGLRDPDTNLTYAVKYLAGAYRAANGNHDRAVGYYASGYYYAAKRHRLAAPGPLQLVMPSP
jgi:soluble lytic murein transglycosylase-like protein